MDPALRRKIDALWRIESARIVGAVARIVRDVGLAEDLAQDALVAALEHWPVSGIPDNPGAWLMRTAKNAALDHLRRDKSFREKCVQIGHDLEAQEAHIVPDFVDELDAARNDTFVGMYVNELTVDYGERGREAVRRLLTEAGDKGLTPRVKIEFAD